VVLISRRWDQARGRLHGRRWLKKPGHRGERAISRTPLRREGRVAPVEPVVPNPCAFYPCTRGRGCNQHPAFPAPSLFEEGHRRCTARAKSCRENVKMCLVRCLKIESGNLATCLATRERGSPRRPASPRGFAGHASPFRLVRGCATRSPKGEAWWPVAESNFLISD
jgi:hypothetical protein